MRTAQRHTRASQTRMNSTALGKKRARIKNLPDNSLAWDRPKGLNNSRNRARQDARQPIEGPFGSKNTSIESLRDLNCCTQPLTFSRQTISTLVQLCTALSKTRAS